MDERLPSRDIVLVGAGHTNMHIVRMWRMSPLPETRLTLISPFSRATYSGMLPGTLAGLYQPAEMEIDLWRFAAPSGVRLIIDEALRIDARRQRVHFRDRAPIRFDVASVGVGSVPAGGDRWSDVAGCLLIKPMATFRQRLATRLADLQRAGRGSSADSPVRVVVAGAGAAGIEICLCLEAVLRHQKVAAHVTLVDSGESILRGYLPGTVKRVAGALKRRGIEVRSSVRVVDIDSQQLQLSDATSLPSDLVVWATSASPSALIQSTELPKADDGFLAVDLTLRSTSGLPVFAVGDSASLIDSPVAKSGVYAVREGPILWENLQRFLRNEPLQPYVPQPGFLSLLADGEGGAFLNYKRLAASGRWCWRYKDHIDRRFMRMYQDYRPMSPISRPSTIAVLADANSGTPQMRCRGCGGKAGANVLRAAFERLSESRTVSSRVQHRALQAPEDAAWLDPQAGTPELISVDFFQPFLDDPWLIGRVAALNALSDLWATGGRPFAALATVQLPEGVPRQQSELLYQLLAGSLAEFDTAEVELLGGHTTEGSELSIGFTVLGSLDEQLPLRKSGLQPGDLLVLTKPLGTGTLLAGIPLAKAEAVWVDRMLQTMLQANARAATAARAAGATAMTDVTGFGLAGHLFEMLDASGVAAEVSLQSLPLLDGFAELSAAGVESTLAPANRNVADRITGGTEELERSPRWRALFDPQTSGGLLIGIAADKLSTLTAAEDSDFKSAVIGQVTARCAAHPTLTLLQ